MNKRPRRRGQSLVEFALIAPIFFVVMFGIIEGGRLLWTYHTLNNAAKEGSRYTMVRGKNSELGDAPATDSKVTDYVLDRSSGLRPDSFDLRLLNSSGSTLSVDDMENKAEFTVEVDYDFDFIVADLFGVNETLSLTSSSTAIFSR